MARVPNRGLLFVFIHRVCIFNSLADKINLFFLTGFSVVVGLSSQVKQGALMRQHEDERPAASAPLFCLAANDASRTLVVLPCVVLEV
jgi:hypothetical protein